MNAQLSVGYKDYATGMRKNLEDQMRVCDSAIIDNQLKPLFEVIQRKTIGNFTEKNEL